MVCNNEGEIVAKAFYERGYNTFVLTYTTDITTAVPLKKQPLSDIERAVRVVRKTVFERKGYNSKTFICGFSAGGHLCASLATHHADFAASSGEYSEFSGRPDGAILSYPVISFKNYVEAFSRLTLIGANATEEENEYFSLETQVSEDTVPCFIWHTASDGLVPVQNSLLFATALKEKNVPFELHIFSHGDHGLGLADEETFEGKFEGDYTFEQLNYAVAAVKAGTAVDITQKRTEELLIQFDESKESPEWPKKDYKEYEDISKWPNMACEFMQKLT